MSSHRYQPGTLKADYFRAGAGVAISGGLFLAASPAPTVSVILLLLAALFGVYGIRTWLRQATVIEVDETGIRSSGPIGRIADREIDWAGLSDLQLRFYSVKRESKDGWMQLVVRGGGGKLRCDSFLEDFEIIARHALDAAQRRDVTLNPTTISNFQSIGLEVLETEPEP